VTWRCEGDENHHDRPCLDEAVDREQAVRAQSKPAPDLNRVLWRLGLVNIVIGNEKYFLADGLLMPTRKDQPPPDLRYFRPGLPGQEG